MFRFPSNKSEHALLILQREKNSFENERILLLPNYNIKTSSLLDASLLDFAQITSSLYFERFDSHSYFSNKSDLVEQGNIHKKHPFLISS